MFSTPRGTRSLLGSIIGRTNPLVVGISALYTGLNYWGPSKVTGNETEIYSMKLGKKAIPI